MVRNEEEKRNEELANMLSDRERELTRLNNDFESSKNLNAKMNEDKLNITNENDKLRNHILVLTNQNQKLIAEIENIIDQDEKMKEQLMRKDRITALLRSNKSTLDQSLNSLDDFLNRSANNETNFRSGGKMGMSNSPRYTYNRSNMAEC